MIPLLPARRNPSPRDGERRLEWLKFIVQVAHGPTYVRLKPSVRSRSFGDFVSLGFFLYFNNGMFYYRLFLVSGGDFE